VWGGDTQVNSCFLKRSPHPPILRRSSVAAAAAAAKSGAKRGQDTEVSRTSYLNSQKCNGAPPPHPPPPPPPPGGALAFKPRSKSIPK